MEAQRLGTDGRRIFSSGLEREQIGRVPRKALTLAERNPEPHVEQSVVRRWSHLTERGSTTAVAARFGAGHRPDVPIR